MILSFGPRMVSSFLFPVTREPNLKEYLHFAVMLDNQGTKVMTANIATQMY
jgi:hypothetical protein